MMQKQYTVDAEMVNAISSKKSYANSLPSTHKSKTLFSMAGASTSPVALQRYKKTIVKNNRGE
jgi:hypothetical protein